MSNSGNQNQETLIEKVKHTIQDTGKAISEAFSNTFGGGATDENLDPNIKLDKKISESIKDSFQDAKMKDLSNPTLNMPEEKKKETGKEDRQKTTQTAQEVKDFTEEKINKSAGPIDQNVDDSWQTTKDKSQDIKDFNSSQWESTKQKAFCLLTSKASIVLYKSSSKG
jgi:hypothetical protein